MSCEVCGLGSVLVGGMIWTASGCDQCDDVDLVLLLCVGVPGGVPCMLVGGALGVGWFLVFSCGLEVLSVVEIVVFCCGGGL